VRLWSLIGLVLVLGAAVPLVLLRPTRAASTPAATWMIGFSTELDGYARRHGGQFPETYGDLLAEGDSAHAGHPVDPWDQLYVYERHPHDLHQARVYTLGDPTRADESGDTGALALYRNGGLVQWKSDPADLPYAWREALVPAELADDQAPRAER
jgi:hypothetical protein